jgi:hypothetical protein
MQSPLAGEGAYGLPLVQAKVRGKSPFPCQEGGWEGGAVLSILLRICAIALLRFRPDWI